MTLLLLLLSVAPGLAIAWFIYAKDNHDREPKKYLIVSFLLGMASTLPAIVFQLLAQVIFGKITPQSSVLNYIFFAFIIVGLVEEMSKFLVLRLYAYPKKAFNEPMDGIVYGVMVAMGFATLENIGYVYQHGIGTALLRMFLSVPAHGAFGALMGYFVGLARFNQHNNTHGLLLKGLVTATFFHGTFDVFLLLKENNIVKQHVSGLLLLLGALVSYFFSIRFSLRAIQLHRELSRLNKEKELFTE